MTAIMKTKTSAQYIWNMPSLTGPFWLAVVVPVKVPFLPKKRKKKAPYETITQKCKYECDSLA